MNNTELDRIDFDGSDIVTVRLLARSASRIKSLEHTATSYFMAWQKWNHPKLGYKHCITTMSEMGARLPGGRFEYALVFRLIYPKERSL
uniref:Uncharacterized protein n=1 Tax=viral metagenome TaxID=1070528 RepID=A0A6H1ZAW3_9ZZZZ